MFHTFSTLALALLLALPAATPLLGAQGLGEVAREERDRREQTESGRVIRTEDVATERPDPRPGEAGTPDEAARPSAETPDADAREEMSPELEAWTVQRNLMQARLDGVRARMDELQERLLAVGTQLTSPGTDADTRQSAEADRSFTERQLQDARSQAEQVRRQLQYHELQRRSLGR